MDSLEQTDVLIAGAGPTGLTLACELARRGVSFRIVDSAPSPFDGSRGKGLQPRTLEVLDDLGLIDRALAVGGPYPRFRAHLWRLSIPAGRINRELAPTAEVPYPNLWMMPQWRTEELLRARLAEWGGHVEQGTALIGFEQDREGVRATLRRGTQELRVQARFLIGCDGGHSVVRKSLDVRLEGESIESPPTLIADVEMEGLDHDLWHVWPLARGCLLTLCPLPGTRDHQLAAPLSKKAPLPELTEEGIRQFVARALGRKDLRVRHARAISIFRPHVRMVDRYRVGRVLLAGDAAHVHPPSGGQGLNTGVQDAYNLGWKLAHVLAGAPDALLDSYQAERLPIAASVLGLSKRLLQTKSARRGRESQQLDLHYRDSPLSRDARTKPGALRAGDRAPDARCLDQTGQPRRLFDLFRGPHATVLAFGDSPAGIVAMANERWGSSVRGLRLIPGKTARTSEEWADPDGRAHASYGMVAGDCAIVRPDGYIGWIASAPSPSDVEQYLEGILGIRTGGRITAAPRGVPQSSPAPLST